MDSPEPECRRCSGITASELQVTLLLNSRAVYDYAHRIISEDRFEMRILTWNCAMAFHKTASAVAALAPDIAVIPEWGQSSASALDEHGYAGRGVGSLPRLQTQAICYGANQDATSAVQIPFRADVLITRSSAIRKPVGAPGLASTCWRNSLHAFRSNPNSSV
jgi:hypothetical protein